MDPGALDVLHDAGDEDLLAVADGVDLDLHPFEILVDEDGTAGRGIDGGGDIADKLRGVVHYLHGPSAEDVAGAHEDGIADALGHVEAGLDGGDGGAGGLGDAEAVEEVLEAVAVLGHVDGVGRRAEDGRPGAVEGLG